MDVLKEFPELSKAHTSKRKLKFSPTKPPDPIPAVHAPLLPFPTAAERMRICKKSAPVQSTGPGPTTQSKLQAAACQVQVPTSPVSLAASRAVPKNCCYSWKSGRCLKGQECRFSHSAPPGGATSSTTGVLPPTAATADIASLSIAEQDTRMTTSVPTHVAMDIEGDTQPTTRIPAQAPTTTEGDVPMEPAPQGPPAHGQTSRVAVPIPAGTQVTWYISIPKSKWKPGLCAHCGGSIMAGHARLRFCQTHGRVFHVG